MQKPRGISGTEVLQRLGSMRSLPVLSPIVLDLQSRIISADGMSTQKIAELLSRDQVISARVLRLANSSFYGLANPVTSLQRAAQFVGETNILALLASSESVRFDPKDLQCIELKKIWRHSLAVSKLSEEIAVLCRPKLTHECLAAGLIHDIGKIAAAECIPNLIENLEKVSREKMLTPLQAELEVGLLGHPVYGEQLAKNWRLPQIVSKAIRYHHKDIRQLTLLSDQEKDVIRIVSLANSIEKYGASTPENSAEDAYRKDLGLSVDVLLALRKRVEEEIAPLVEYYFAEA